MLMDADEAMRGLREHFCRGEMSWQAWACAKALADEVWRLRAANEALLREKFQACDRAEGGG